MQVEMKAEGMEEQEVQSVDIRDTDLEVLRTLRTNEGTVAFQGLRRQMNMHQEKLSRALQRLEEEGFICHGPKGYSLTPRGVRITQQLFLIPPKVYTTIIQSMLPGGMSPRDLASYVEGRWFSDLRWLGIKEEGEETTLRWMLEANGAEVQLRLRWGQLIVETDATEEAAINMAFIAANRIVFALLQPFRDIFSQGAEVKLLGISQLTMAGLTYLTR